MITRERQLYISELFGVRENPWTKSVEQLIKSGAWDDVIRVAKEIKEGQFNTGKQVAAEVLLHTIPQSPRVRLAIHYDYSGRAYNVGDNVYYEAKSRGVGVDVIRAYRPLVGFSNLNRWEYLNTEEAGTSYADHLRHIINNNLARKVTDPRHGPDLWVDIGTLQRAFVPTNPRVISISLNALQI